MSIYVTGHVTPRRSAHPHVRKKSNTDISKAPRNVRHVPIGDIESAFCHYRPEHFGARNGASTRSWKQKLLILVDARLAIASVCERAVRRNQHLTIRARLSREGYEIGSSQMMDLGQSAARRPVRATSPLHPFKANLRRRNLHVG